MSTEDEVTLAIFAALVLAWAWLFFLTWKDSWYRPRHRRVPKHRGRRTWLPA